MVDMSSKFKNYIRKVVNAEGTVIGYQVLRKHRFYISRYGKSVTITPNDPIYDGATGALDIESFGWVIHDVLCRDGCFDDGTPCNNMQASLVLYDVLKAEGRYIRARTWFAATWLFGGGKARKNGMY